MLSHAVDEEEDRVWTADKRKKTNLKGKQQVSGANVACYEFVFEIPVTKTCAVPLYLSFFESLLANFQQDLQWKIGKEFCKRMRSKLLIHDLHKIHSKCWFQKS